MKRPSYNRKLWLKEKLGFFTNPSKDRYKSSIWIHAVSVGEVISTSNLVTQLKKLNPESQIVLSTVTDTGFKIAQERLSRFAKIIYAPFDIPFFIKKTLNYLNPSLLIIVETEIWPNLINEAKKKGIPILLINGRISEKSYKGYKNLKFFMKKILDNFDEFCMQNNLYAERIESLGANSLKVTVTGNIKFDISPSGEPPFWTKLIRGLVIVAGSTHDPEEKIILEAYKKLITDFPKLILILAPRHPNRFQEVETLVRGMSLKYIRRSDIGRDNPPLTAPLVIILDVIGELATTYSICDIAIIGGSFISHGGHNPLEPAYWKRAIICGHSMENFPFIEEFYKNNAAIKSDEINLYYDIHKLLNSEEKRSTMGMNAFKIYQKNIGATEKTLNIIKKYFSSYPY
ncbi:MAG: 3-deoxy-D-manno-octulosonic acid transferase [Thermodesulfovibrionales bacterium]|nr:3-deoxy-D-manno-octulosonic acid transferase [Thermodesulfovibrionales bacterium]